MYQLQFQPALARFPELLWGLLVTVELTIAASIAGTLIGAALASLSFARQGFLGFFTKVYVEIIRNTPFLVQLFILYFGLAGIGFRLSAYVAAFVAMTINLGAYATEIIRAGVESVRRGQIEAGLSLGLTRFQAFVTIVLPLAIRNVYPALCSQLILMFLGSSLCSAISTPELTGVGSQLASDTFKYFEVYILITALYLTTAITLRGTLELLGAWLLRGADNRKRNISLTHATLAS